MIGGLVEHFTPKVEILNGWRRLQPAALELVCIPFDYGEWNGGRSSATSGE